MGLDVESIDNLEAKTLSLGTFALLINKTEKLSALLIGATASKALAAVGQLEKTSQEVVIFKSLQPASKSPKGNRSNEVSL